MMILEILFTSDSFFRQFNVNTKMVYQKIWKPSALYIKSDDLCLKQRKKLKSRETAPINSAVAVPCLRSELLTSPQKPDLLC
jgi:hypothetical protein